MKATVFAPVPSRNIQKRIMAESKSIASRKRSNDQEEPSILSSVCLFHGPPSPALFSFLSVNDYLYLRCVNQSLKNYVAQNVCELILVKDLDKPMLERLLVAFPIVIDLTIGHNSAISFYDFLSLLTGYKSDGSRISHSRMLKRLVFHSQYLELDTQDEELGLL